MESQDGSGCAQCREAMAVCAVGGSFVTEKQADDLGLKEGGVGRFRGRGEGERGDAGKGWGGGGAVERGDTPSVCRIGAGLVTEKQEDHGGLMEGRAG
jgi:hypothetical protein